jgi:hypothetical protein
MSPIIAQDVPITACLKVIPLSPAKDAPVTKSKKNKFSEDNKVNVPCKIVAKKDIAEILSAIVAGIGRRLNSF